MTTDKVTKALLFAIAVALWAHLTEPLWRPTAAEAQFGNPTERRIREIRDDVRDINNEVQSISYGLCLNSKIC